MSMSKRIIDIVISFCAILLSFPIFLIASLLIWIEDRGPILFRQKRLGRNGKVFTIYKFRKFSADQNDIGPNLTLEDDHRYSKIGKLLEKTKLNELPQLINVLRGEMSLVGPRPEIVDYINCFQGAQRGLLNFTPGIFGPSQSFFRNEAFMYPKDCAPESFYVEILFPLKAKIDIEYYNGATVASDLYWVYRSIVSVYSGLQPAKIENIEFNERDSNDNFKSNLSGERNLHTIDDFADSR